MECKGVLHDSDRVLKHIVARRIQTRCVNCQVEVVKVLHPSSVFPIWVTKEST